MLLQANKVSKYYGITPVLTDISFHIQARERMGLVGVNGAGKSTLLKIIAGELSPDSGSVYKAKETTIGYLAQNGGLQSDLTIWEEMISVFQHLIDAEAELRELEKQIADPELANDAVRYEETLQRYAQRSDWFRDQDGYAMETRVRSVLHGMGFGSFDSNTRISTLSGGQKTRLALARMLLQQPDVLLLDEPTNHLDIRTLTWLEQYLRSYPGAVLVVSHDRYFLDAMVTGIVQIERHQAKRYTGNYSKYMELKAAEYEHELKQYEKQQEDIAKMEAFIQKNIVRASTTKRAQSRRKALDKMERVDKPLGDLKRASFSFEIERTSGRDVLRLSDASVSFDPDKPLFQNVNISLDRGEIVALIGPNGIGKSTLLKSLIDKHPLNKGRIQWGTHVSIGYYDQEQETLNPNNTVLEEVWSAYPHFDEVRIRTVLGSFLFSGDDVTKKIGSLSGGEKARVALAKLMLLQANMLILDEPTNHLDLFSKEVLEAALMDYEGTLLFISHDRYFLNKMAERVIELTPHGAISYLGNYDDYTIKKQEMEEDAAQEQQQPGRTLKNSGQASASNVARTANSAHHTNGARSTNGSGTANASSTDSPLSGSAQYELDKQKQREERARQRRAEQLEAKIAELEAVIEQLETELADPEVYNDYVRVQDTQEKIQDAKGQLEQHYAEWETCMES